MATKYKLTMKWNVILPGAGLSTGFSESYFWEGASIALAVAKCEEMANVRKFLLPKGADIFSCGASPADNPGIKQIGASSISSPSTYETDTAWQCFLCHGQTNLGQSKNIYIHSMPDKLIVEGGFVDDGNWSSRLNTFLAFLRSNVMQWRGVARGPFIKAENIDRDTGFLAKFTALEGATIGQRIKPYRTRDQANNAVKGPFTVVEGATAGDLAKLVAYKNLNPVVGAWKYRVVGVDYFAIENTVRNRVIFKKTGRPFGGLVGRRSNRR